jgi:hypothetical protein
VSEVSICNTGALSTRVAKSLSDTDSYVKVSRSSISSVLPWEESKSFASIKTDRLLDSDWSNEFESDLSKVALTMRNVGQFEAEYLQDVLVPRWVPMSLLSEPVHVLNERLLFIKINLRQLVRQKVNGY